MGIRMMALPSVSSFVKLTATLACVVGLSGGVYAKSVGSLLQRTHIHGLAVDQRDPARLLVATHHGLYVADLDGSVKRLSQHSDDLMGFSPHPTESSVLYASGHPATGGNLGVIRSDDGGLTWSNISPGANGPVDFHQMTVSLADPAVLYGIYGGLQRSDDAGKNWRIVGSPPKGTIAIASSATDVDALYASTEHGIRVSRDGGKTWHPAHPINAPATAITNVEGTVYAYLVGHGLVAAEESRISQWRKLGPEIDSGDVILHLAVQRKPISRMIAATWKGLLLVSQDEGRTWQNYGKE